MNYTATIGATASILRRQDFESQKVNAPGFEGGHLEAIWETYGSEPLVLVETDDGFGVIGHLHGVSSTPAYGNPTLGITGLYEGAEKSPTYYRGFKIRQVTVLDGHGSDKYRVLDTWRTWKMDALKAVRATLPDAEAWAGIWEMTPVSAHEVSVRRTTPGAPYYYPSDHWTVYDGQVRVHTYKPITES